LECEGAKFDMASAQQGRYLDNVPTLTMGKPRQGLSRKLRNGRLSRGALSTIAQAL
jgi:hypothetical protein